MARKDKKITQGKIFCMEISDAPVYFVSLEDAEKVNWMLQILKSS